MYKLNCVVSGDDYLHIFQIKIEQSESVSALRSLIKDAKKPYFNHVAFDDLVLWQVNLPVDENIELNLSRLTLDTKTPLSPVKRPRADADSPEVLQKPLSPVVSIARIFPSDPPLEHVHIVVQIRPGVSSGLHVPHHLVLNCIAFGDDAFSTFEIKIAPTESVGTLKKVIKDVKRPQFDHVPADHLKLWQVKIDLNDLESLNVIEEKGVALNPLTKISEAFTDGVEPGRIHVVVQPVVVQGKVSTSYSMAKINKEFETALESTYPSPSTAAKSKAYRNIQRGPAKLYDGRYAHNNPANTNAPPIQLFNPAFAYFSSKAFDPEYAVPDEMLRNTQELMTKFAAIHASENDRHLDLIPLLAKVIKEPLLHAKSRSGNFEPDAVVIHSHDDNAIRIVVVEEKNEVGDGVSDPSVQASFSFIHQTHEDAELRLKCNCPTFLIAHAGPWLAVLGAVFTEKYIIQRLTDFIWIPAHSALDDDQFLRIGRVMYALSESVEQLRVWYDDVFKCNEPPYDVSYPTAHPRFYPTPDTYLRDEIPVRFKYERPLEHDASCVTYLAKTKEDNPINVVVKFVTRYGEDVHRVMAEAGFAPKLLYYGKIDVVEEVPSYGGLRMVVMEYVDGKTAYGSLKLPPRFRQELTEAIEYCHKKGFVFGDLRKPNIMITKDHKVQLIDFDWAGRQGKVTYPVSISPTIHWPEGAQGLGPILKQHDLDMLARCCN